jgi:small subunit ribosomal protein S15
MAFTAEQKAEIIIPFKHHEKDTGSSEVQIAIMTNKITYLTEHLREHKKDHASRRGLLKLVSQRRKLLDYLRKGSEEKYLKLIESLNIRK